MTGESRDRYFEIGRRLRSIPVERHITSYEWEELVERLCASDDIRLHDIGVKEQEELVRHSIVKGNRLR